jgi:drug/metabolite transporter (DMT)-like permease
MNNAKDKNQMLIGDGLVTIAMMIFGAYPLFLGMLPKIPVLSFLFAMHVIGAVGFFLLARRQGFPKMNRTAYGLLLLLAVTTTANDLAYFYAFRFTSVANAAVSHQLVSVFLLFLAPYFLKEKTVRKEWIALAIALIGIVILFGPGIAISRHDTIGIVLGLLSAFFYASFILIYRYMPKLGYTLDFMNFWRYAISTVMLLPLILLTSDITIFMQNFWYLAAFGILFTVIASRIHTVGIAHTRSLHVSIIGKSEPVIATVYALLFLSQIPPVTAIIGGILIVGASLWLALSEEKITETATE